MPTTKTGGSAIGIIGSMIGHSESALQSWISGYGSLALWTGNQTTRLRGGGAVC